MGLGVAASRSVRTASETQQSCGAVYPLGELHLPGRPAPCDLHSSSGNPSWTRRQFNGVNSAARFAGWS